MVDRSLTYNVYLLGHLRPISYSQVARSVRDMRYRDPNRKAFLAQK